MRIDVSDKNLEKVTEIANLLARFFPDHEIRVKQTGSTIAIKVYQKKLGDVPPEQGV